MWTSIITAVATIVVAAIEFFASKERKKAAVDREEMKEQAKRSEERAKLRAEESTLSMQMINASLQLSVVCANALTGGHNNGNVEEAKVSAEKAQNEYEKFIKGIAATQLAKV